MEPDPRARAILDAALEVFLESGVESASIEEIRRRSGASVGSLYHRYGSKEGIAAAVYVEALGDYQRDFVTALERSRDAVGGITSVVRTHLRWVRQNADRAEFLFTAGTGEVRRTAGDRLQTLNDEFFATVTAWLAVHVRAGTIRAASTDVTYALWLGPSQELARLWLARGRPGALRTETTLLADAAWRSLRNEEENR
jgi:AcrR family transcriptional regulator